MATASEKAVSISGWISLSNAQAYVRTTRLDAGPDSDADGLADPWEYGHTNTLTVLSGLNGHDADNDGATDLEEAIADTDPLDSADLLAIVSLDVRAQTNRLEWMARPTRLYRLEATNSLTGGTGIWFDAGGGLLGPPAVSPMQQTVTGVTDTDRFYRVRAVVPLAP